MLRTITTAALAATLAMPALAQQKAQSQQGQQQTQTQQSQNQQKQSQQGQSGAMSEQARACLDQLEQIDTRLAEVGYGRAGPSGYGVPTTVGRTAAPSASMQDPRGMSPFMAASTPRSDMHALMRAGYIMAVNGYDNGCQQVAAAAEDISNRYEEAMRSGDVNPDEMLRWRGQFLASSVSVSELDQPMRAEEIIGADVRNMRDEDLGDVNDVVFGANGEPLYVIVSTGGFLGLGENEVPVPWDKLRITAAPYRDTFVVDVSEQVFQDAPQLEGNDPVQFVTGDRGKQVDSYWQKAGSGKSG